MAPTVVELHREESFQFDARLRQDGAGKSFCNFAFAFASLSSEQNGRHLSLSDKFAI